MNNSDRPAVKWMALQWICLPILMIAVVELTYQSRWSTGGSLNWYRDRIITSELPRSQILFVGTSRTRSAVDEDVFRRAMIGSKARCVINLGMGNCPPTIHLHALRNRLAANPDALRGSTIFVETPQCLPSFYTLDEFFWDHEIRESDPWRWHLYLDSVTTIDPVTLMSSHLDLEGRIKLAIRAPLRDFLVLGKREIIGMSWRGMLKSKIQTILDSTKVERPPGIADLVAEGGIRTDSDRVQAMIHFEDTLNSAIREFEKDLPPTEDTPAGELIDLALANGAKVVCFDVPMHSSRVSLFRNSEPIQNGIEAFREFIAERGVAFVVADFQYSDVDFPDRSHLSKSRSPEFTRRLVHAWQTRSRTNVAHLSSPTM
ncbi:hypothetical protein [Novipirellula sp.]|uniref:hypothetical protein n=1 Tax=Novipirellula sp. TaxID=2795430 RepID=UPI003568F673